MVRPVSEHIRSNIVGYVALFPALGGVAWAAESAPKNSVTSKSIDNGAVKTQDLGDDAVTGDKVAADSLTGAQIAESTLTGVDAATLGGIPATGFQRRVDGACPAASAIRAVGADGTVSCESIGGGGGGDITGVTAGTGLSGGGTSGDVSLGVNPAQVQSRVTANCGLGAAVTTVLQDGSVSCNKHPDIAAAEWRRSGRRRPDR